MIASFLLKNTDTGRMKSSSFHDVDNIDDKFVYLYARQDNGKPEVIIVPHKQISKIIEYDERFLHNRPKTLSGYKYGFLLDHKVTASPHIRLQCPNCHSPFTTESDYEGFRTCRICGHDYRDAGAVTRVKHGSGKSVDYAYPDVDAIVQKYHETYVKKRKRKPVARKKCN